MTDKFQINLRHQFKSFEKGLITFSLAFVGVIIFGLFGVFDLSDFSSFVSFALTCVLFSLPALYLHISYLLDNHRTILVVDRDENRFTIKTADQNFTYRYVDVESTELNLTIYYKNQLDNRGRWPAPWTNYGYLKLKLKDGKVFYLTSLMLNLDKLMFPVTATRFRPVPYIYRKELKQKR